MKWSCLRRFTWPVVFLVYGYSRVPVAQGYCSERGELHPEVGCDLRLGNLIGRIYTIPELMKESGFEAVFIGSGADCLSLWVFQARTWRVYSANEFLIRVNLMKVTGSQNTTLLCGWARKS